MGGFSLLTLASTTMTIAIAMAIIINTTRKAVIIPRERERGREREGGREREREIEEYYHHTIPMIAPVLRPLPLPGSLVGGSTTMGGEQDSPSSVGTRGLVHVVQLSL